MSLQLAAQHLAAQGRGPDTTLVHMAPHEVEALQKIARAHGGSLTINPQTGLPEAGFLSSILPMIAGAVLAPLTGGAINPMTASMLVGGVTAATTGSLTKGLIAGLGAYGGAGLGSSLSSIGETALASSAAANTGAAASAAGTGAGAAGIANMTPAAFGETPFGFANTFGADVGADVFGYPVAAQPATTSTSLPPSVQPAYVDPTRGMVAPASGLSPAITPPTPPIQTAPVPTATPPVGSASGFPGEGARSGVPRWDQALDKAAGKTPTLERMGAGLSAVTKDPSLLFNKANMMNIGMATAPILFAGGTSKAVPTSSGNIQYYDFDNTSNRWTYLGSVPASDVSKAGGYEAGKSLIGRAHGGLAALAGGGVARFQDGGTPLATREEVLNAYRNTAGAVVNPDETAIDYWMGRGLGGFADVVGSARAGMNQNQLGAIDAARTANQGVLNQGTFNQMLAAAPAAAPVAAPAAQNITTQTATTTTAPTQAQKDQVANIYRNVLGRDPDAVGLDYWAGRLAGGESLDNLLTALKGSARTVLGANADTLAPGLKTITTGADAIKAPTTYVSSVGNTIGDEWVRNILGREPTAADKAQGWYKNLDALKTSEDVTRAYNDFLTYAKTQKADAGGPASWFTASQLLKPKTTDTTTIVGGGGNDTYKPIDKTVAPTPGMPTLPGKYTGGKGTVGTPDLITKAYQDFWVNTPVGTEMDWAGGKLKRVSGNKAIYTGPDGKTYELFSNSNLNNIAANNPYIGELWRKEFGLVPKNYVTGASLKAFNYLMGQGKYPTNQEGIIQDEYAAAALGLPRIGKYIPNYETGKMELNPNYKETRVPGLTPNANAPEGMQDDYDSYWSANKVGSEIDFAGGKLKRVSDTTAEFTSKDGKVTYLRKNSRFDDIANAAPDIAALWATRYGFKPGSGSSSNTGSDSSNRYARGGLSALARYAEGGETDGFYDESGNWRSIAPAEPVPTPAPSPTENSSISAALAQTVADAQAQGAATAPTNQGVSDLAPASSPAYTNVVTDPNIIDQYVRLAYANNSGGWGRTATPEEIQQLSGKTEQQIRDILSQAAADWNKNKSWTAAEEAAPYWVRGQVKHEIAPVDWSQVGSLIPEKSTVDTAQAAKAIGGTYDAASNTITKKNPDGSTTVVLPDGSNALVPAGSDPRLLMHGYQGPQTGNFGVVGGEYKGYAGYDPASTLSGSIRAFQVAPGVWRDTTGQTYDHDPTQVKQQYFASPLGYMMEMGRPQSEIQQKIASNRQREIDQYRPTDFQPVGSNPLLKKDAYNQDTYIGKKNFADVGPRQLQSGQWLGDDGNLYQSFEHGQGLVSILTDKDRDLMKQERIDYERKNGPYVANPNVQIGPAHIPKELYSQTSPANRPDVFQPYTQDQMTALAKQIVRLGYDPTRRYDPGVMRLVAQMGGTMMLARGGISSLAQSGQFNLGDYSDGGRLLKGPGDGVSDSIPASIGGKRPARLADGEFVVPARIVSELGNGSTEAGARKLYAMMDRIQANRRKSVGRGKVAVNSKSDKYLPA